MSGIDCTLLTDGSSDAALIPILRWLLTQHAQQQTVRCEWADMRHMIDPPRKLAERIVAAVELYPCDLLFVHRDAEAETPDSRHNEVKAAADAARLRGVTQPYVCVVPVRMQEAWLLLDEVAIRRASGNPSGKVRLELPDPRHLEELPDPKSVLHKLLVDASEHHGRRRHKFRPRTKAHLVSQYVADWSCLRALSGFQRLEADVQQIVEELSPNFT